MPSPLTSAQRFQASAFAAEHRFDGPYNLRWCIDHAGQVEGFPHSYTGPEVDAAVRLIEAAARRDTVAAESAAEHFLAVIRLANAGVR